MKMKKLSILFSTLLLLAIGFSSCSDDLAQPPITIPEGGLGTGSWTDPYTATQILGGSSGKGKWVTGYIVGWIDTQGGTNNTMSAETCTYTVPATLASNILIAADPNEQNFENCIPVQLPSGDVRTALNLMDHPENLGKQVTVKANVEKYFGKNEALKSLTAYNWGDKGIDDGGDNPDPDQPGGGDGTGETIYTGLVSDSNDWTFENINKPDGINDIWSWKVYNNAGYLNASAYVSGKPYASEALAISPEISLAGMKKASVDFDHASKFQTTLRQMCGIMVREAGTTTWTTLSIPTWPEPGTWTFANSGAIDLSAYTGKKIQLAFKYGSSAEGADTWEIKNFKVSGTK